MNQFKKSVKLATLNLKVAKLREKVYSYAIACDYRERPAEDLAKDAYPETNFLYIKMEQEERKILAPVFTEIKELESEIYILQQI